MVSAGHFLLTESASQFPPPAYYPEPKNSHQYLLTDNVLSTIPLIKLLSISSLLYQAGRPCMVRLISRTSCVYDPVPYTYSAPIPSLLRQSCSIERCSALSFSLSLSRSYCGRPFASRPPDLRLRVLTCSASPFQNVYAFS